VLAHSTGVHAAPYWQWPGLATLAVRAGARSLLGELARQLARRWFSIDLRTLGLFRIAFGVCLIGNLLDHALGGGLTAFYSNDGVLTNHFALYAPIQPRAWSLLFAFSRPGEVMVAFAAIFAVYALYTVGWKTKVMQVLVIVCFISLVNRNLLLQDGGSFVSTILAVWTVFLPLGARFSVDGLLARRRAPAPAAPPAPGAPVASHVSVVCFLLMVQLAVIYGMNAANKTGVTWHEGTAVHYILWHNGFNTGLAGFLRHHEPAWLSPLLTWGCLVFEWSAPVLALTPVLQTWARRLLLASMVAFHVGIASLMSLGPFAYVMMAYGLLLLGPRDWEVIERWSRRLAARWGPRLARFEAGRRLLLLLQPAPARAPAFAPAPAPVLAAALLPPGLGRRRSRLSAAVAFARARGVRGLREATALVLAAAMAAELTLANAVVSPWLRFEGRPQWMAEVVYYLRIYQTWGMFAPDAPMEGTKIVVDAVRADGTHVDPLTGVTPDFQAPLGGPYLMGHDWSEYMMYYPWERHRQYRDGLRDYIVALDREARARGLPPDQRLRSFEIHLLTATLPPPGEKTCRDLKRELLLSHVIPD
jgi:hypothetical protein